MVGTDAVDMAPCRSVGEHFRRNDTWVTIMAQGKVHGLAGQSDQAYEIRARQRARRYLPHSFPRFDVTSSMYWSDSLTAMDRHAVVPEPTRTADWVPDEPVPSPWVEAGLPMVLGTDMNLLPVGWYDLWTPGFIQHEALLGFVLAGMTPLGALRTATLNPALALRATDSLGTVEAGKAADLVLLDADPLTDIWHTTRIRAVVANGRYYDRAALDQLLRQAEQVAPRQ